VTRGAQPVAGQAPDSLLQAPLWGFARSLVLEHPELGCRRIDLDPRSDVTVADELLSELLADDSEDEVGWRSRRRYGSRLARISEREAKEPAVAAEPSGTGLTLQITERGTLENLALAAVPRRPPAAGELEVRVAAASLNFRDVLNALGMYPGDPGPLGNEVSGTVTAVGPAVEGFGEGDEVVSLCAGGFGTYVTVQSALTARKPAGLSFDVAASTPIAFLTARYGLSRLAGMREGARVLVHAAAGGVGIAAVRLALGAGAEVFATAGSGPKRDFLRGLGVRHVMDSRTTLFADEVMAATSGRGVDIVLNSLTGEFIPKSLSVLARGGRFIEIGKSGIWEPSRVAGVRPDVSYHVLYLGDMFVTEPALIREMLDEVLADLDGGRLAALPLTRFPLEQATDAFRYMAQARHIGKIVLLPEPARVAVQDRVSVPIRADATYLVTGGLGALGRHVARGLVERGARCVALVGRRPPDEDAREAVAAMEAEGTRVVVFQADVSNREDVARLFTEVDAHLPPLAGIVHAAGVVDDGVVAQQSWARFSGVLAPKMTAAWLLHQMTRSRPLDFMVFFSSVASVLGSPGQAPYAAANAFLDALAHDRHRRGLPALSANWGSWAGGGMAGSLSEHDRERFARLGFGEIDPGAGIDLLFQLLGTPRPQLMVAPIAWPTYLQRYASQRRPARFSLLAETGAGGDAGRASDVAPAVPAEDLRSRAIAVPAPQRLPLVMAIVREEASTVLGLPSPARLDVMRGLRDAGLDSLMAVELRNRLQTVVGRPLPATLAFDHPTVDDLARYLASDVLSLDLVTPAVAKPGAEDADPRLRDAVSDLSDAEAEAQLAAEIAALEESRRGDRDV
jgi:NADPH:quinone reductase-like Zn-dependent oxidoreductase